MANARKPKRTPGSEPDAQRPTAPAPRTKRPAAKRKIRPAAIEPAPVEEVLTPDRIRHAWALQHPDRPEIRAALERLYRQSH